DGIRDWSVTGVQTCALPISPFTGRSWSKQIKELHMPNTAIDEYPDTDEIDAQNMAEYENAALDEGKAGAGIKKPTSTELSIALDTIRAEIAYSKYRNVSERKKNLDNPLHAKLPYLTWQGLEGCVRELELRVRTCVTEEALGEAATIPADILKRSA